VALGPGTGALSMGAPRDVPVLVALRALGLGDLLTAVPALRALAKAFPGHRRILAAPRALAPLALLTGTVDEVAHTEPLAHLPPRCDAPDVLVNLHGRGPESHRVALAAGARRTVAFANAQIPGTDGWPRWRAREHEVRRWCRLLEESGIEAEATELRLRSPASSAPASLSGATVIHAGAGCPERVWPPERWARVAAAERAAGREIVLTGAQPERPLAERIALLAGLDAASVVAGRTDLGELTSLVAAAGRVLSCDTGIAHLATALGVPSVTLFGPSPPGEWGPLIDLDRHVVLWVSNGSERPCVADIRVEAVLAALRALPEHPG
jgi:ADP-heptose:LPS heptosyltransferase